MIVKFNKFVSQIELGESILLVNSETKEYVALHKDIYIALQEVVKKDYLCFDNVTELLVELLTGEKNAPKDLESQIENTILYLVDNHFIDTNDTIQFDSVFNDVAKSCIDVNILELPKNVSGKDLQQMIDEAIKPYMVCDVVTCFNPEIADNKVIELLSALGSVLNICITNVNILEYLLKNKNAVNISQIDRLTFIIFPEQYNEFKHILKKYDMDESMREKTTFAPIIDWHCLEMTREIYAILLFMGFNVLFCAETLCYNYEWQDAANYKDLFALYEEIVDECGEYGVSDSTINQILNWPLNKVSYLPKNATQYTNGILYFTNNNIRFNDLEENNSISDQCCECSVRCFCNAPKNIGGSCDIIKEMIIYRLVDWEDSLSLRDNVKGFIKKYSKIVEALDV